MGGYYPVPFPLRSLRLLRTRPFFRHEVHKNNPLFPPCRHATWPPAQTAPVTSEQPMNSLLPLDLCHLRGVGPTDQPFLCGLDWPSLNGTSRCPRWISSVTCLRRAGPSSPPSSFDLLHPNAVSGSPALPWRAGALGHSRPAGRWFRNTSRPRCPRAWLLLLAGAAMSSSKTTVQDSAHTATSSRKPSQTEVNSLGNESPQRSFPR